VPPAYWGFTGTWDPNSVASVEAHGTSLERVMDLTRLVAGLGSLTSALLIYRVLIELPAGAKVIDQKLGAVLGLGCAVGVALGG